jgi:hypothetical protein
VNINWSETVKHDKDAFICYCDTCELERAQYKQVSGVAVEKVLIILFAIYALACGLGL